MSQSTFSNDFSVNSSFLQDPPSEGSFSQEVMLKKLRASIDYAIDTTSAPYTTGTYLLKIANTNQAVSVTVINPGNAGAFNISTSGGWFYYNDFPIVGKTHTAEVFFDNDNSVFTMTFSYGDRFTGHFFGTIPSGTQSNGTFTRFATCTFNVCLSSSTLSF